MHFQQPLFADEISARKQMNYPYAVSKGRLTQSFVVVRPVDIRITLQATLNYKERIMPIIAVDHHLDDFDAWFELFVGNPPPEIGNWRLIRGMDDPNRVRIIGEMTASEVKDVKEFMESERMQKVFSQVNEMSTSPLEFVWFDEVAPG